MASHKQVVEIDALINARVGNLNDAVSKLQKGISQGVTKMDLSKGTGKALTGYIRTFQDEYQEFQKYIKTDDKGNSFVDMDDSGKALASGKRLLKTFEDIQQVMTGINSKDAAGLAKLFPQGEIGSFDDLLKSLEKIGPKLKELQDKQALKISLTGDITSIEARIEQLKTELAEDNKFQIDVSSATANLESVEKEVEAIQEKIKGQVAEKTASVQKTLEDAETEKKTISTDLTTKEEQMKKSGVTAEKDGTLRYKGKTQEDWEKDSSQGSSKDANAAMAAFKQYNEASKGVEQAKARLTELEVQISSAQEQLKNLAALSEKLESPGGVAEVQPQEMTNAGIDPAQVEQATDALERQRQAQEALNEAKEQEAKRTQKQEEVDTLTADVEAKKKQVEQLGEAIAKLSEKANLSQLTEKLKDLGFDEVTEDSLKSGEGIKKIKEALANMRGDKVEAIKTKLKEMGIIAEDTNGDIKLAASALDKFGDTRDSINRAASDLEGLKNRMLDFFSISNSVRLFKRTLQQAFNTVKELDAVMTQTAVVTDFSVGDMWDKLPEYSARATELGASISSLYEATTLYYQQGLETDAAMGVGVETMKMARIAGLEAGDATQYMTAALRGFNMEVNELNATRVNDVYSELAAITASDTAQIATAMGKTASIAASANMEFETTAALLAQIIETTQEAPETAGTAMKTIIARFTEVKSLFSEGQLKGEDEEGEAIDINKIDAALKSVGISLKDFLNGQKGIDDIFLELASKWDTLDLATQRYIATTAAGSRQQSRFIAMMSDYGRTMELVSAANNSAGASQRQFDKTQESLEAKLQKLKNAWQQFTMSIMNSDVIKAAVSALTGILNLINGIIDKLSGGSGLVKGFLSLGTAITALSIGNSALTGILKFLSTHTVLGALPGFKNLDFKSQKKGVDVLKSAFMGLSKLLTNPYFWGAAAAVGAVAIIVKAIDNAIETEKEKRERLGKEIESSNEAKKNIQSTRDVLKADLRSLRDLEKGFDNLTLGTTEWKEQLLQANQQALDLANKYDGLQLETGAYGQLTISESSYQEVLKQQEERISNASAAQASASLELADMDYTEELRKWRIERGKDFAYSYAAFTGSTYNQVQGFQASGNYTTNQSQGFGASGHQTYEQFNEQQAILDGISDNQIRKYMTALMEAGINSVNLESRRSDVANILKEQGYAGNIDSLIASMISLGSNFDTLGASALTASLKMESLERNFYASAVAARKNKDITDDSAINYLDWLYEYEGGVEGITAKIEADLKTKGKDELLKQYAEKMGYTYHAGKIYADTEMTIPIELGSDDEQTKNIVASALADIQAREQATNAVDNLKLGLDQRAFEIYFGDASDVTVTEWEKYYDIDKMGGLLGLKEEDLWTEVNGQKVLTGQGARIQEYLNTRREQIAQRSVKMLSYFGKYGSSSGEGADYAGLYFQRIKNAEQQFGKDFIDQAYQAMQSVEASGDENLTEAVFNRLINSEDAASFKAASDLIGEIDWSNPINAAEQIQDAMQNGAPSTREFAKELNELGKSFLGTGSQVRYFAESTEFGEVKKEIQEIIDKNGEFTAADILDLADDYGSLGKILDNTGISATGLAKILEKIGDGSLEIYQLTDAVLAAAEGFDSLEGVAAETLKAIDDFDPGLNETEVVDFSEKAYKTLTENFKKGYWGNSQNFEYLDFFFGPDWDEGLSGEALRSKMQELTGIIGEGDTGLQRAWQNILNGKTIDGKEVSSFDLSSFDTKTSEEVIKDLAKANNISEEYAGMLLTYMKNMNPDFAAAMKKTDLDTGLQKFLEASEGTIDESELLALSEIYDVSTDYLREYFKVKKAIITQYRDENGKLRETSELITQLNKVYGTGKWGVGKTLSGGVEYAHYNYKLMTDSMTAEGFSQEEAAQATQDMINEQLKVQDKVFVEVQLSSGELTTLTVTEDIDLEQAINKAEFEEQGRLMAIALNEAFGEKLEFDVAVAIDDQQQGKIEYHILNPEEIHNEIIDATSGTYTIKLGVDTDLTDPKLIDLLLKAGYIEPDGQGGYQYTGHAKGIKNSPTTHDALVGEKGAELIQRADGTAYLSGMGGPEVTKIHRGDTVYTAEETRQIFRNRGKTMPRFEQGNWDEKLKGYLAGRGEDKGYWILPESQLERYSEMGIDVTQYIAFGDQPNFYISQNDNGKNNDENYTPTADLLKEWMNISENIVGLGGEEGATIGNLASEAKTSLDKLYNLLAQIEEQTRQRERLERRYETLIKDTNSNIKDIVDNSKAQLAALEAEKTLQESLIKGRQAQIDAYVAQNSGYSQYAGVETNEYGEQVLRIDWDAINAISNDDERKKVEEYISKLEGWFDELYEAEQALWDIDDAVEEINERGKEEYLDFEEQIKDALLSQYQEEIDQLSAIDESINNANSSMMQAIQDSINQQRQERDNAKTEEELAEKERRLQYLKQDTSGANALEIMELEKELAEGREDYTDTLIDQKIEELQKQNDAAAEQRQKQIEVLTQQKEIYERSEQIWKDVHNLINNGIDNDGIVIGSSLHSILEKYMIQQGLSSIGKEEWWSDLDKTIKSAMAWLQSGRQLENLSDSLAGKTIDFAVGNETLTGKVDESGNVVTEDGAVYKEVYEGIGGVYRTEEGKQSPPPTEQEPTKPVEPELPKWIDNLKNIGYVGYGVTGDDVEAVEQALKELGYWDERGTIDKTYDSWTNFAIRKFQLASGLTGKSVDGYVGNTTKAKLLAAVKAKFGLTQFKTGGVADFTGPAWLDGTKSRPEIILNQQDSRNFIQLKDILSSVLRGGTNHSTSTENNRDIVYDIDINVEKLEKEVDLDTISSYVERKITETARYRNNNAVKISR